MAHSSGSEVALPGAVDQRQIPGGMGFKILFFYLQHDFFSNAGTAKSAGRYRRVVLDQPDSRFDRQDFILSAIGFKLRLHA
jgi:hypothetical protein